MALRTQNVLALPIFLARRAGLYEGKPITNIEHPLHFYVRVYGIIFLNFGHALK